MGAILTCGIAANAQWLRQATAFAKPSRGISQIVIVDANTSWAIAYDGSGAGAPTRDFTRTSNGGTLWKADSVKATPAIDPNNQIAAITAISKDTAWVSLFGNGTSIGGVYRTNDGGMTWTKQATATYNAGSFEDWIYFWDKNNGVAFGDPNTTNWEIYYTTNGGTTWTAVPAANLPTVGAGQWGVTGVFSVAGGAAYGGTNYGAVLKSVDMGVHWTASTVHGGSQIDKVVFKDANNGMAVVGPNNDSIYTTTNGGTSWTYVPKTGRFLTSGLAYASGLNGGSYVCTGAATGMVGTSFSTNNGATWQAMDTLKQHTAVSFMGTTGWTGSFDSSSTVGGIYKWMGMPFAINEIQPVYQTGLSVYPNPNNGTFQIALSNFTGNQTQITVYDLVGNLVFESSENTAGNLYVKEVDLTAYPTGMYIVRVQDGAKVYTAKAIRQ